MSRKHYSVIIAPPDGKRSYQLQVSSRALWSIAAGFLVLVIGVVFLAATYGNLLWKVRTWNAMAERIAELEEKEQRIAVLESELESLLEMDRKVRQLVGLPDNRSTMAPESDTLAGDDPGTRPPDMPDVQLPEAKVPGESERSMLNEIITQLGEKLSWPVDGFISSEFGEERGSGGVHSGVDIAAARNSLIEAPLGGTVSTAGWNDEHGYVIVLDHSEGVSTVYCHNAKLLVRSGEKVSKGDAIAFLGSTGRSSAPHLHFEIRKNGFAVDPLDLLIPLKGS